VAQTSNNRVIMACELCCCFLPQCETLLTCHSGFPIATLHVLKGLAKDCAFSDVTADMYREELTRSFICGLACFAVRQRLLGKEELCLNQAFELADNLDRAHCYSRCMGPLVPDQSLPIMTSDSNAKNYGAAACTRRSSSSVVKAVSFFFCGLDTHQNRS